MSNGGLSLSSQLITSRLIQPWLTPSPSSASSGPSQYFIPPALKLSAADDRSVAIEVGAFANNFNEWTPITTLGTLALDMLDGQRRPTVAVDPDLTEDIKRDLDFWEFRQQ